MPIGGILRYLSENRPQQAPPDAQQGAGGQQQLMAQGLAAWGQLDVRPIVDDRQRRDPFDCLADFSVDWAREGLELNEIVVPKHTFHKLSIQLVAATAFYRTSSLVPKHFVYYTALGPVRIVCQEDRTPTFNFDKYMETVE